MRLLAVALVATVLSGCTSPSGSGPETVGGPDVEAVTAALRELDPCALLPDADAPVRTGPFACRVGDDPALTVTLGVWLDPDVPREVIALGGVRAVSTSSDRHCATTLLTGADLGIAFAADTARTGLGGSLCALAEDGAIAAVDLLEKPERLAASGPRQDACELLRRAGRDAGIDVTEDTELRFGPNAGTGLGLCQARQAVDGGWRTRFSARITHTRFGSISNERPDVLDGRDVRVYDTGDGCEYGWRVRESGETAPYADTVIQLRGDSCEEAAKLASALMPSDTDPSPSVAPKRPIVLPA
ncbi:hypothetical protein [Actinophytocola glycyrrhizae]|uniref:DUF3558 domain-containing protein n=1 Tax=Actinophytocola glycyrrhizae TaxID=2044873 RepID=A0ABV9RZN4_9PSEU